jgi:hypothetical protein
MTAAVAFVVSSGILAAGNPGVAAARVAASAALIHVSLSPFADSIAPASPNRVVLTRCLSDNVQFSCSEPPKMRTVYISGVIISQQS